MKFTEILRKLGILRYGSYSWKGKGKDRPIEAIMDDVYDSKKDLIHKDDVEKVKEKITTGNGKNIDNKSSDKKRKIIFWIFIVVGVLFFLLFLMGGFSLVLFIFILLWGVFFIFLQKFLKTGVYSSGFIIGVGIVLVIVSFSMLAAIPDGEENGSDGNKKSNVKVSSSELKKYDKKIVKVQSSDGKVQGTIGLEYTKGKNSDYLYANYNLFITDTLKVNGKCLPPDAPGFEMGCGSNVTYEYANNLVRSDVESDNGEGSLSRVYCNQGKMPEDPFGTSSANYDPSACNNPVSSSEPTNNFIANFGSSFSSYEDILAANVFELYDSSNFWEVLSRDGDVTNYTNNTDKAVVGGEKIKTYNLKFSLE